MVAGPTGCMPEPLVIEAGELSVAEMMDKLESGRRIIVQTEFLGSEHEVTLRYNGDIYYCDSPTILHKHTEEDAMRDCIEKLGFTA